MLARSIRLPLVRWPRALADRSGEIRGILQHKLAGRAGEHHVQRIRAVELQHRSGVDLERARSADRAAAPDLQPPAMRHDRAVVCYVAGDDGGDVELQRRAAVDLDRPAAAVDTGELHGAVSAQRPHLEFAVIPDRFGQGIASLGPKLPVALDVDGARFERSTPELENSVRHGQTAASAAEAEIAAGRIQNGGIGIVDGQRMRDGAGMIDRNGIRTAISSTRASSDGVGSEVFGWVSPSSL